MTNEQEKSDLFIVMKLANKPGRPGAESVEPRKRTEGNTGEQHTCRTQSRESVSQEAHGCQLYREGGKHSIWCPCPVPRSARNRSKAEQPNADFLISFTTGTYYFTVRALKRDAEDHLTVIFNRKAYVLRLSASDKPFYTVTFFQDATSRGPARPVVPERLLSLMDKAKAYPLFEKDYPDVLVGVLHAAPNTTNYYDKFKLLIRDVWRFEQEDTLVFRIELENSSDSTIYYKPQDLAVRLEDRIYTQSIADASGVMPPKSTTPAFFAITGNGQGGRNNLAPDNRWNVLVVRAEGQQKPEESK